MENKEDFQSEEYFGVCIGGAPHVLTGGLKYAIYEANFDEDTFNKFKEDIIFRDSSLLLEEDGADQIIDIVPGQLEENVIAIPKNPELVAFYTAYIAPDTTIPTDKIPDYYPNINPKLLVGRGMLLDLAGDGSELLMMGNNNEQEQPEIRRAFGMILSLRRRISKIKVKLPNRHCLHTYWMNLKRKLANRFKRKRRTD